MKDFFEGLAKIEQLLGMSFAVLAITIVICFTVHSCTKQEDVEARTLACFASCGGDVERVDFNGPSCTCRRQ